MWKDFAADMKGIFIPVSFVIWIYKLGTFDQHIKSLKMRNAIRRISLIKLDSSTIEQLHAVGNMVSPINRIW